MREKGTEEIRHTFSLNYKQITLLIVGSIGVISLFFVIGIWLGKNLIAVPTDPPNQGGATAQNISQDVDALPEKEETKIEAPKKEDETNYDFQKSLGDKEIIPLKEEAKTKIAKEDKPNAKIAKDKKDEIDNFSVKAPPPPPTPPTPPAPVPVPEKKQIVTEVAKTKELQVVEKGKYAIQLASYKSDADASSLVNKLRKNGYSAYFVKTDLKDKGIWYRVKAGGYSSKDDANKSIKIIEKDLKIKGLLVKGD